MSEKYKTAALQNPAELQEFIGLVRRENVRRYLEIGCKHGGSLWHIGSSLPRGSTIVAVDLPHGDRSFKDSEPHLRACVRELVARGFDAHLIIGDSTDASVIDRVRALAPFDLCFIDANHTEKYVRADWASYGPLARIVAFHDIDHVKQPAPPKMPIEVFKVWAELKQSFACKEIKFSPGHNGIGVLWQRANQ